MSQGTGTRKPSWEMFQDSDMLSPRVCGEWFSPKTKKHAAFRRRLRRACARPVAHCPQPPTAGLESSERVRCFTAASSLVTDCARSNDKPINAPRSCAPRIVWEICGGSSRASVTVYLNSTGHIIHTFGHTIKLNRLERAWGGERTIDTGADNMRYMDYFISEC